MTQTIIAPVDRTVRFYGIGGCGINLVRTHMDNMKLNQDKSNIYSNELYALLDTSRSNLDGAVAEHTYIMHGVDGSGGDRKANAARFKQLLPEILDQYKPGDFNIVVFGIGGGSGSAGGPQLIEELLKRGHTVDAVLVGISAEEALRNIRNAVETMAGLEMAVARRERPIAIHYSEVDPALSYLDNDTESLLALSALSILYSGRNPRVDKADIDNFHDYNKVTPQAPALSLMRITSDVEKLRSFTKVTSYIALMDSEATPAPRIQADYSKLGLISQDSTLNRSIYYTLVGNLGSIHDNLKELQKVAEARKVVKVEKQSLVSKTTEVDEETGLVFDED